MMEAGADGPAVEAGADSSTMEAGSAKEAGAMEAGTDGPVADMPMADMPVADMPMADMPAADMASAGDSGAGLPTFTAPFSWDFESSCMGLSKTVDWACGQVSFSAGSTCSTGAVGPTASASGTGKGMWGTVLNDCHTNKGNNTGASSTTCSNTKPADDSILSFNVTIPASWTSATLTYYSWEDVNGYFDWFEVRVNNVSAYKNCNPKRPPTGWVKRTIDLSAHVGKTVPVAFHFLASSVVAYAGWYIDDVSVTQGASVSDGGVSTD